MADAVWRRLHLEAIPDRSRGPFHDFIGIQQCVVERPHLPDRNGQRPVGCVVDLKSRSQLARDVRFRLPAHRVEQVCYCRRDRLNPPDRCRHAVALRVGGHADFLFLEIDLEKISGSLADEDEQRVGYARFTVFHRGQRIYWRVVAVLRRRLDDFLPVFKSRFYKGCAAGSSRGIIQRLTGDDRADIEAGHGVGLQQIVLRLSRAILNGAPFQIDSERFTGSVFQDNRRWRAAGFVEFLFLAAVLVGRPPGLALEFAVDSQRPGLFAVAAEHDTGYEVAADRGGRGDIEVLLGISAIRLVFVHAGFLIRQTDGNRATRRITAEFARIQTTALDDRRLLVGGDQVKRDRACIATDLIVSGGAVSPCESVDLGQATGRSGAHPLHIGTRHVCRRCFRPFPGVRNSRGRRGSRRSHRDTARRG